MWRARVEVAEGHGDASVAAVGSRLVEVQLDGTGAPVRGSTNAGAVGEGGARRPGHWRGPPPRRRSTFPPPPVRRECARSAASSCRLARSRAHAGTPSRLPIAAGVRAMTRVLLGTAQGRPTSERRRRRRRAAVARHGRSTSDRRRPRADHDVSVVSVAMRRARGAHSERRASTIVRDHRRDVGAGRRSGGQRWRAHRRRRSAGGAVGGLAICRNPAIAPAISPPIRCRRCVTRPGRHRRRRAEALSVMWRSRRSASARSSSRTSGGSSTSKSTGSPAR